jgi:hypothetical protein
MNGLRHFMRNLTARAVREHLESQAEAAVEAPELTTNELDLVRYVVACQYDWRAFLDRRDRKELRSVEPGTMDREDEPPERWHSRDDRKHHSVEDAPPPRERKALELGDAR